MRLMLWIRRRLEWLLNRMERIAEAVAGILLVACVAAIPFRAWIILPIAICVFGFFLLGWTLIFLVAVCIDYYEIEPKCGS